MQLSTENEGVGRQCLPGVLD